VEGETELKEESMSKKLEGKITVVTGGCQRRYKLGPTTGLKTGQSVRIKSLGSRLGMIGCGEAAAA
jgi:hypothetical protein